MHVESMPDAAPRDALRRFRDAAGGQWTVQEVSTAHVEWARGTRCLLFGSEGAVRRVWGFPAEWWRLSDAELETLSWAH